MGLMEVKYVNQGEFGIDTKPFSKYISKLKKATTLHGGELNVVFVNDQYIRALNKSYRGKDAPTDVLSFNYEMEGSDSQLLGEVYISVETAKRQAKEHKHTFGDEIVKLIVHGILHIHGYDHEKDSDYKKMYKIEHEVLGKVAGGLFLT